MPMRPAYFIASGSGKTSITDNTVEERSRYENLEELLNGIKEFTETAVNENRHGRHHRFS